MKLDQAFPSNFLKSSDIGTGQFNVTIKSVDLETMGQGKDAEDKLMVKFNETTKVFVCNKTNAKTIAKLHGDDTDMWIGKPITLGCREVDYQGETTLAIRVSLLPPQTAPA